MIRRSWRAVFVVLVVSVSVVGASVTVGGTGSSVTDGEATVADGAGDIADAEGGVTDGAGDVDDGVGGVADGGGRAVLVVAADGSAAYESIQAAVDAAAPGDEVRVRPGVYREQVRIESNVTVEAPGGAVLDGHEFGSGSRAFRIEPGVAPVIEGFTVRGYAYGVHADRPPRQGVSSTVGRAGWVVRDVTFVNCSEEAIRAGNSMLDWTVERVVIDGAGGYQGITTFGSHGDWTVRRTVIRNVSFEAIGASTGGGNWTIRNVSIANTGQGIDAGFARGNGTIVDVGIRSVERGVQLDDLSGSISIRRAVIENVTHPAADPAFDGVGIYAVNATGSWRVSASIVHEYSRYGINATGAEPPGDATGNWWGSDGRPANACVGNVNCGGERGERPPAGAVVGDTGAHDQDDWSPPTTTRSTATSTPWGPDGGTTTPSPGSDARSAATGSDRSETDAGIGDAAPPMAVAGGVFVVAGAVVALAVRRRR